MNVACRRNVGWGTTFNSALLLVSLGIKMVIVRHVGNDAERAVKRNDETQEVVQSTQETHARPYSSGTISIPRFALFAAGVVNLRSDVIAGGSSGSAASSSPCIGWCCAWCCCSYSAARPPHHPGENTQTLLNKALDPSTVC